eukprot:1574027-Pyramimonas_sp.AAC.1
MPAAYTHDKKPCHKKSQGTWFVENEFRRTPQGSMGPSQNEPFPWCAGWRANLVRAVPVACCCPARAAGALSRSALPTSCAPEPALELRRA